MLLAWEMKFVFHVIAWKPRASLMPGRMDNATYASAIAKNSEVAKYATELRQHLREVVNGPAFKVSRRSAEFLTYIVERSLRGESEELRERTLGIEIFGRPADYDTGEDAIVRVTASDVRKRLLQHYGSAPEGRLRIELPPGSYVPEFRRIPSAVESAPTSPATGNEAVAQTGPKPLVTAPLDVPETKVVSSSRKAPRLVWIATIAAIVCTMAVFWLLRERFSAAANPTNFLSRAFPGTFGNMQVIVSDDGLLLIEVLLDHRFTLQDYENLNFLNPPEMVKEKGLERFWDSLSRRQVTNFGNFQSSQHIADQMHESNWNVSVRNARQMNAREFQSGNFVILGSSHTNPWAALFEARDSNFPFDPTPLGKSAVIQNISPLPGEPPNFQVHQDPKSGQTVSYARLTLVPNIARNGRVLIIAGQSMASTEFGAEFVLQKSSLAKVLDKLRLPAAGPLPDLEMMVRVTELNEVGDHVELVACRRLNAHSETP
jgi:hypothetical protein